VSQVRGVTADRRVASAGRDPSLPEDPGAVAPRGVKTAPCG